ncbi:hypothetical protein PHYPO_G00075020 [Pangasianodon hypophthalmus]|uniref:UPAR/Ly6 domain-containing protein n=1 Tax=Pangasianodon hypophthalmus TaxID=310915 RepID=A0A5N5LVC8_PANHP|nr:uncharacterized protein LOC117599309 [Pangasianodon hypophthalmus]KAB5546700.1 hypothetical protein PHYPO_G00075020 [Pangasianodon hypophthalmus]
MRPLVTLVFICMLLPKAAGELSCYTCNPLKCEQYDKGLCPSGLDYCLSASATLLKKTFTVKTCATKQICDLTQSLVPGLTLENVKCCQGNLCNGAESFTLSFLLMFIPLLSSILFY